MGKTITVQIDVEERGRNGGKARARNMTPAARSQAARDAAAARWGKKKTRRARKK